MNDEQKRSIEARMKDRAAQGKMLTPALLDEIIQAKYAGPNALGDVMLGTGAGIAALPPALMGINALRGRSPKGLGRAALSGAALGSIPAGMGALWKWLVNSSEEDSRQIYKDEWRKKLARMAQ